MSQEPARHGRGRALIGDVRARASQRYQSSLEGARAKMYEMEADSHVGRRGARKRSVVAAGAGLVALGSMFGMVSSNVMAVGFTSANSSYNVYSDRVVGKNAAGFVAPQALQNGSNQAVLQFGFKEADVYGLCMVSNQAVFGAPLDVGLVIRGGEPVDGNPTGNPTSPDRISAQELYLATNQLTGAGENIARMTLGQSADTLTMGTIDTHRGNAGDFGLQVETLQVKDMNAQSYGVDLKGQINMPNLKINVLPRTATKADCAS